MVGEYGSAFIGVADGRAGVVHDDTPR
jgi:hypothetical protein